MTDLTLRSIIVNTDDVRWQLFSLYVTPPPAVCLHMPHFSPFSRMGMGYGMGMATMGCLVGPPLMSIPSPHQVTSYVPMPGYSTYPSFCPLSQGVPFAPIPEFAAAMATSIPSPPTLQPGPFSAHRRESGSQEAGTTQVLELKFLHAL